MIHHKDSCWGITLFRFGRRKLELWFVPKNYACVEHTHKDSDGEFFVLYGKGRNIWRKLINTKCDHFIETGSQCPICRSPFTQCYNITNRTYFRWLTVKANVIHGFSVGSTPMIFLCWETYREGVKVTSPALDFHPTTTL